MEGNPSSWRNVSTQARSRGVTGKLVRDEQRDTEIFSIINENGLAPDTDGMLGADQRAEFRNAIKDHFQSMETTDQQRESVEIDKETASRLRDLGYVE